MSTTAEETRVAILEDEMLVELMVERPDSTRIVGDLYLGKVEAVLPGIQAAFVDIGTDKVSVALQGGVPHHLVDLVEPTETYSAAASHHADASSSASPVPTVYVIGTMATAPSAVVAGPRRKLHTLLDGERQLFASPLSLEIQTFADREGSPLDSVLAILDEQGVVLAINDDFAVSPQKAIYRMLTWSTGTFELEPSVEMQVMEEVEESTELPTFDVGDEEYAEIAVVLRRHAGDPRRPALPAPPHGVARISGNPSHSAL